MRKRIFTVWPVMMAMALVACEDSADQTRVISDYRELDAPVIGVDPEMSTAERLGFIPHDHDHHHHHDHDPVPGGPDVAPAQEAEPVVPQQQGTSPSRQSVLAWSAPQGWVQAPERPMREVTFVFGDDSAAECYVAVLHGDGGGLVANLNRWLNQFSQSGLSEEEVAALPRVSMLGTEAVIIEAEGDYTGMVGDVLPDAALLGAVCPMPEFTVFVKMTGPASDVLAERDAFLAFCESLQLN